MTDICEAKEKWDDMDEDEKLEVLEEFVNELIEEMGYDPVNVTAGPEDDDTYGAWYYDTDTINFNEDALEDKSFEQMLNTAVHEVTHASDDFEAGESVDLGEDTKYEKYTMVFENDPSWGPQPVYSYGTDLTPDHQSVQDFAEGLTEQFLSDCKKEEQSQYGAEQDLPQGDWVLPEGDTAYA